MSTEQTASATGSCLCRAVRYEVTGPLRSVLYCHCEQCRKTSGHFVAATACHFNDFHLLADDGLRWYRSSSKAERGFCSSCGASLFWRPDGEDRLCIMAGTLDRPTNLQAIGHIFVEMASDYHRITDGLPQYEQNDSRAWAEVGEHGITPKRD